MIADGEVTGHAHVLDVATTVLHDVNGEMYVEVLAPTELRHDCPGQTVPDHNPLPLAPGVFKYVPQCEEFAGDIRKVID